MNFGKKDISREDGFINQLDDVNKKLAECKKERDTKLIMKSILNVLIKNGFRFFLSEKILTQ